ncbi:helix-turn-helix domain-containing protein [Pantoea ananatis]|uniref:helix-turn-helix domain-containing protein n=1 Tax=Pantoea ananas TaxID=553 RepID=UPI001B317D1A|nr:helix-turn-helix domain-containing protein [Pantoea ananatis]
MSSKLQGYVWDACAASGVKGTKLMVMVRLSDYSSDEGASYPGVKTIARQIGAGESTIRTAISELEADGWLTRENRRKGNRNTSNMYFLNVDKLEETAMAERKAIKENRLKTCKSHHSDSDYSDTERSDFEASDSEYSTSLDPSESGKNARFDPSESGGHDPQDLKHDPQVKDTEPQEMRPKKKSFDPASAKPQNVSDAVWADWIKFRRERRSALTETTCQYQAKQLAEHGNADEVIRRSIASGWQGLFPERVPSSQADSEKAQPRPYAYKDSESSEVFLNLDAMRSDSGGNRRW